MKNNRKLLIGFILGVALTLSITSISAVTTMVNAYIRTDFTFEFDGVIKPVPPGYTVLVYEGRSYVPARFVAENLGADVEWDELNKRVVIFGPEEIIEEPEEEPAEEPEVEEEQEEEEESIQPEGRYRSTPVNYSFDDMDVTVTSVLFEDEESDGSRTTRVYLKIDNEDAPPLQVLQGETVAIVDGVEYLADDVPYFKRDNTWYQDVRTDSIVQGYIMLPTIPLNSDRMALTLRIMENDRNFNVRELEFLIDLR